MTGRKIEYWIIPPEADAEFAAAMEDVLEVYEKPYAPAYPVLNMDEQPVQLLKETRTPIPATKEHGKHEGARKTRRSTENASIMNTNGRERPTSSCSPNLWPAGARSR